MLTGDFYLAPTARSTVLPITTILITTYRVRDNIILLFIVGMIVASVFEYVASLFLEKVFHIDRKSVV